MFYRAAIVKEDKNARSITLREMTKEKVEEMIPRIKSFLYPDEDASEYRYRIWEHEVDGYGPGIKIPEYTVNVNRELWDFNSGAVAINLMLPNPMSVFAGIFVGE